MARELRLIVHPFHNGLEGVGMGAGPLRLIGDPALSNDLRARGWRFRSETIEAPDAGAPEIARVAEGDRRLARRVRSVAGEGAFDGMGLAILTGNGWDLLRGTIAGFAPVAERDVVLVGVRDVEPHQEAPLAASALRVLRGSTFAPAELSGALDDLRRRVPRVYLHIDLDALDPSEGRANPFAADGGLSLAQLERAIELVFERFEVAAAAITAYDPTVDEDGRMARSARRVLTTVLDRAVAERAG